MSELGASLSHQGGKDFLHQVLRDDRILFPFISAPASLKHHHAYPGGLLQHCLQCTSMLKGFCCFSRNIEELGIVASQLHDIGKISTLTDGMQRTALGQVVDHDAPTLELLVPALTYLDRAWPDGGIAMR